MESKRLSHMLHKVAWNTYSELFYSLDNTFRDLLSSPKVDKLSSQLRQEIRTYLEWLHNS
jgi:glutathionyl-hydroquinone reductase